ncbi:hypothetical protein [Hymenobacter koreensis]|uniref:Uncharacterized protein n=1 Tax=Hymenobacter koreensis TaxID=1084523 RepID=A0ABP8J2J1_9BACT
MLRNSPRATHFLTLLFGGALVVSFGVNVLLLTVNPEPWPEDPNHELTATTADLHLTQRLLAQCQKQHQQQDSLLVLLRSQMPGPALAEQ